jgi:acetyltransferase-like isoleucine patch superfamily enzyme/acyl carrier protein
MAPQRPQVLKGQHYIRHKLYANKQSAEKRYAELVVGDTSLGRLFKYELITALLGLLPGALGLFLRQLFYPQLFKHVGKGVVFGRAIVVRNAHKISLGDRVVIDDYSLLDARGAGDEGVSIGDEVIINRGVSIQSKVGPIHIGSRTDIGAGSSIISQGGVYIGEAVALGGDCKIGGGLVQLESAAPHSNTEQAHNQDVSRTGHQRITKGPVYIEAESVFGWGVTVMDSVRIGRGCVVDAGIVLKEDVPGNTVVTWPRRLVLLPRLQTAYGDDPSEPSAAVVPRDIESRASQGVDSLAIRDTESSEETHARITRAIFRALDILNEQLPQEKRLAKTFATVLWGQDGGLDSLGLVNLIVAVEESIAEEFGVAIPLTNGKLPLESSVFVLTVGSLGAYVGDLLEKIRK